MTLYAVELFVEFFTIINLVILFLLIWLRKDGSQSSKMLGFLLLDSMVCFVGHVLNLTGWVLLMPHWLFFGIYFATLIAALTFAPIFFSYVNMMLGIRNKLFHVINIPALLVILLYCYYCVDSILMKSSEQDLFIEAVVYNTYPWRRILFKYLFVLVHSVYFTAALFRVSDYSRKAKNYFSDLTKSRLRYIQNFVFLSIGLNLLVIFSYTFIPRSIVDYIFFPISLDLIYIYLISIGFVDSAILSQKEYDTFQKQISPVYLEKSVGNKGESTPLGLSEVVICEYHKKVEEYLIAKKPFIDPGITIEKLARQLRIPRHHLSLVINRKFGRNFFNLINYYRVEEAKAILDNRQRLGSIDTLCYDIGYNTKSAFYRAFKKHTHLTPVQYEKRR